MDRFEIGASYGVLHLDDRCESVAIASRNENTVTLADGRCATILHGIGPQGADEELVRLDEDGALARGGVVRACQRVAAIDSARAAGGKQP